MKWLLIVYFINLDGNLAHDKIPLDSEKRCNQVGIEWVKAEKQDDMRDYSCEQIQIIPLQ